MLLQHKLSLSSSDTVAPVLVDKRIAILPNSLQPVQTALTNINIHYQLRNPLSHYILYPKNHNTIQDELSELVY